MYSFSFGFSSFFLFSYGSIFPFWFPMAPFSYLLFLYSPHVIAQEEYRSDSDARDSQPYYKCLVYLKFTSSVAYSQH